MSENGYEFKTEGTLYRASVLWHGVTIELNPMIIESVTEKTISFKPDGRRRYGKTRVPKRKLYLSGVRNTKIEAYQVLSEESLRDRDRAIRNLAQCNAVLAACQKALAECEESTNGQ